MERQQWFARLLSHIENGEPLDGGRIIDASAVVYLSASGTRRISVPALFLDLCALLPPARGAEMRALYATPHLTTRAKVERLLGNFDDQRTLVLLDNFEDLIDLERLELRDTDLADALRAWLEAPSHSVKLIVTSRAAPRDILIEQPALQGRIDLEDGLPSPYAENILRAMDVDSSLGLRTAPAGLLDKARQRTRGYPRALEALFAILSADCDSTLEDVLADTARTLPENVVRALVGEAFSRLDARSQQVMQALAIYQRPVNSTAVDYLLLPYINGFSSAPTLNRLVNMRFVKKEGGRYFLHPIDRDYALSRIPPGAAQDRGDPLAYSWIALLHRAAEYYREARTDPSTWKELADLTIPLAEFDLRAEGGDFEGAFDVWLQVKQCLEGWSYYHLARDAALRIHGKVKRPRDLWIEASLGAVDFRLGRYVASLSHWETMLERLPELRETVGESWTWSSEAWCHSQLGNTSKAIELSERALAAAERDGDMEVAADTWSILGWYYAQLGENERALECCTRGVELHPHLRGASSLATAMTNLADVLLDFARYEESLSYTASSIETDPANTNLLSWNYALTTWAHLCLGNLDEALAAAERAGKCDEPENNPMVLNLLGIAFLLLGRNYEAIEALRAGVTASELLLQFGQNCRALDAKGVSCAGLVLCTDQPVDSAVNAHGAARAINRDRGVIARVLWYYDRLAEIDPAGKLTRARAAAQGV